MSDFTDWIIKKPDVEDRYSNSNYLVYNSLLKLRAYKRKPISPPTQNPANIVYAICTIRDTYSCSSIIQEHYDKIKLEIEPNILKVILWS